MLLGIHLTLLIGNTIPLPAPVSLLESLKSIKVKNTDKGQDGFEMVFSAGKSGIKDIMDYPILKNPLLKPFNRVIIMVTLGVTPKVLIDGIITNQQFAPNNDPGQSTLTIIGEDISIMMDMEDKPTTHPNQPDSLIVRKIILSYSKYGLVPNYPPPPSNEVPLSVQRTPSQIHTDLDYIIDLANLHHYVFYIEPTNVPGINTAYWGPAKTLGIPQNPITLNMGVHTNISSSSINFQYNALLPTLIKGSIQDSITNKKIPIRIFARSTPPLASQPPIIPGMSNNVRKKQGRNKGGVDALKAYSQAQAETDKSTDAAVTASGNLDTLRYGDILRARRVVSIRGAGQLHDGLYYIESVTHNIKKGDYKQSFSLRREGIGSLTPVVPFK
jgi:hypothetical protein